jgi:hypothetical protein
MKQVTLFVTILAIVFASISCNNHGTKKEITREISTSEISTSASNVNIYYFHFTLRCSTCLAVEENAGNAIEALYPNEFMTGEYSFTSLNLDEASTKDIADKLGIGGQTLMVVRGDKKIDITSAAWLSAHDPDKMKAEIKSGIDKVLY